MDLFISGDLLNKSRVSNLKKYVNRKKWNVKKGVVINQKKFHYSTTIIKISFPQIIKVLFTSFIHMDYKLYIGVSFFFMISTTLAVRSSVLTEEAILFAP